MPFIHLSTTPGGTPRQCCFASKSIIKKNSSEDFNLGSDSIGDIWNSQSAKDFRMRFAKGEKPEVCKQCWIDEDNGRFSKRKRENKKYLAKHSTTVQNTIDNEGVCEVLPSYVDIRLGNLCNLKCRICHASESSTLASEVQKSWDKDGEFYAYQNNDVLSPKEKTWYKSETYWDNFEKIVPALEHIYLVGGEPTIIPDTYKVFEKCFDHKREKHIHLRFNTNFQILEQRFLDDIVRFKSVRFTASIDGDRSSISYLRHPAKWELIEENLRKCLELPPHIELIIHFTASTMNLFNFEKLYWDVQEIAKDYKKPVRFGILPIHNPKYLSPNILLPELKKRARKNLESLSEKIHESESHQLLGLLNIMDHEPENAGKLRQQFKDYTLMLDRLRGENFAQTFPDLTSMLD